MINYLKTYLEVNEFENIKEFLKVGELIDKNPNLQIVSYNYKSFVLENYKSLINKNIDLEIFFQSGDIDSKKDIFLGKDIMESIFEVYSDIDNIKNSIVIVTDLAYKYFQSYSIQKLKELEKVLKKNNSYLFVL